MADFRTVVPALNAHSSQAETWDDDEFDLPEGHSLIDHLNASTARSPPDSPERAVWAKKTTTLFSDFSSAGSPERHTSTVSKSNKNNIFEEEDEDGDDDWDADLEDLNPSQVLPNATYTGTITRLGAGGSVHKGDGPLKSTSAGAVAFSSRLIGDDEDDTAESWEADLDFASAGPKLKPAIKLPLAFTGTIRTRQPLADLDTDWDADGDSGDIINNNNKSSVTFDDGDVSTLKMSKLPFSLPAAKDPAGTLARVKIASTEDNFDDDEDGEGGFEDAFELPKDLSRLSLRPRTLAPSSDPQDRALSALEWTSDTTSSLASESPSRFGFHHHKPTTSSSSSTPSTASFSSATDEEDGGAEEDLEGLIVPDSVLPRDLMKILNDKRKTSTYTQVESPQGGASPDRPRSPRSSDEETKKKQLRSSGAEGEDDDFEDGLVFDDDAALNRSRLQQATTTRRPPATSTSSSATTTAAPVSGRSPLKPKAGSARTTRTMLNRPRVAVAGNTPTTESRGAAASLRPGLTALRAKTLPNAGLGPRSPPILSGSGGGSNRSQSPLLPRSKRSSTSSTADEIKTAFGSTPALSSTTPVTSGAKFSSLRVRKADSSGPFLPSSVASSSSATPNTSLAAASPATYAMLTVPRYSVPRPASPSKIPNPTTSRFTPSSPTSVKHQKSQANLASDAAGSSTSASSSSGRKGMVRRNSYSDATEAQTDKNKDKDAKTEKERTRMTTGKAAGAGAATTSVSPTFSTPNAQSSIYAATPRYNAHTLSSRAKVSPTTSTSPTATFIVPRPTTPGHDPITLRLTQTTTSTRAKARKPISALFPSSSTPSAFPGSDQPEVVAAVGLSRPTAASAGRAVLRAKRSPEGRGTAASKPPIILRPKHAHSFGDGTELDHIDDLVVEAEKEGKYRVMPKSSGNTVKQQVSTIRRSAGSVISAVANVGNSMAAKTTASSSLSAVTGLAPKRPSSRMGTKAAEKAPAKPGLSAATIGRRQSRQEVATATSSKSGLAPKSSTFSGLPSAVKKRRPLPTQRKPTLIKNLGGVGGPKVVGDMKWNPSTLRWEGNEGVLRNFESPAPQSRPALISHLSTFGSSANAKSAGSFVASGTRIVGNMLFDPAKMCWVNRFDDEEPDPFAGILSDDDQLSSLSGAADETWGKGKTSTVRARAPTPSFGGTRLETVLGSPARPSTVTSHFSDGSASGGRPSLDSDPGAPRLQSEIEDDFNPSASPSRSGTLSRRHMRGASTSPIPGVDDAMIEATHAAESRHQSEVKGWFPSRSKQPSLSAAAPVGSNTASSRRKVGIAVVDDDEDLEPDRSYLFEIRAIATKPSLM